MSCCKRLRLSTFDTNEVVVSCKGQDVFFNGDLLQLICYYLYILDITKLFLVNKIIYNYFKKNEKSLYCIKNIIKYDFGQILSSKYYKFDQTNSCKLIKQIYCEAEFKFIGNIWVDEPFKTFVESFYIRRGRWCTTYQVIYLESFLVIGSIDGITWDALSLIQRRFIESKLVQK